MGKITLPTEQTAPKTKLSDMTIVLYGAPKIGKSTFCSRSEKALFLATEPGLNALNTYQIPIGSWEEMGEACALIAKGDHDFKTIVIDTIDNAYKYCVNYTNRKLNIVHEGDLAKSKGYTVAQAEFFRVLSKLASLPYGLFIVAHSKVIDIKNRVGETYQYTKTSLSGGAEKIIADMADFILFCDFEPVEDGETTYQRVLRTRSSPDYLSGGRYGFLPDKIPFSYKNFTEAFETGARKMWPHLFAGELVEKVEEKKKEEEAPSAQTAPPTPPVSPDPPATLTPSKKKPAGAATK